MSKHDGEKIKVSNQPTPDLKRRQLLKASAAAGLTGLAGSAAINPTIALAGNHEIDLFRIAMWSGMPNLDPEQNATFNDHYLEVDYDLSDVMFVTTANTLNILPPLLDRLEVIRIPGYTEDEKINIANKYLFPKQIKNNGVKKEELNLSKNIIQEIIRSYTKESGVRNLEREISKLARKTVKRIVNGEEKKVLIDDKNLSNFLGVKKFKFGELESENKIGIVIGLAWT